MPLIFSTIIHMQTERLEIRLLKKSDAASFYAAVESSRAELDRFLPWPARMLSERDASDHIGNYVLQEQLGNGGLWGIFQKPDARARCKKEDTFHALKSLIPEGSEKPTENFLIGALYLHYISESNSSGAIGYWLATEHTGKGYATEALNAFCNYLLDPAGEYALNRIEAHAAVQNTQSTALLKRCHFTKEGLCREYEKLHGEFLDHLQFSLLRSDLR